MGKPNPILTILVHHDLWELECVKAWREAGHNVGLLADETYTLEMYLLADVILGPNCHFFTAALDKHGDEVLKWARKRRKESKQR